MVTNVALTLEELATLKKILDNIAGMEMARICLPIYDKLNDAVVVIEKRLRSAPNNVWEGQS